MFYFSLPTSYPGVIRAWKSNASTEDAAIAQAIVFLNIWNKANIAELPAGTQIVKL